MDDFKKITEISNSKINIILNDLLDITLDRIDIQSNVFNDIEIDNWINKLSLLKGSSIIINNILKSPINNKELLINRQNCSLELSKEKKELLKKYEDDILWIYSLNEELNKDVISNIIFPSQYVIKYINYNKYTLNIYHLYKILIIPLLSILSPIFMIIGCYFYFKRLFNISIKNYFKYIYIFLKYYILNNNKNFKNLLIKIITIIIYIILYIYNIYLVFELSYYIHIAREKFKNKINNLYIFLNESIDIIKNIDSKMWMPYYIYNDYNFDNLNINNSLSDIYKIWKNNEIKNKISNILKIIYTIDIVDTITKLKNNNWCIVNYNNETKIWGMKNPILLENQTSNPLSLNKNLIITGPNAAGKTTYIKSIIINIIFSHTIGLCYANKANTILYDTIKSFMRVSDVLGSKSYFQAEAEYCSDMIKTSVELYNNNKKGLFIMDEPMHSTPPTEGMAVAYAVSEYIGNLENISLIITTHYHKLIELEKNNPNKFINLCVDAYLKDENYTFTYKINKGFSNKCIAIELLEKKYFPIEIINSAIKMKNKICNEIYSK